MSGLHPPYRGWYGRMARRRAARVVNYPNPHLSAARSSETREGE